MRTPRAVAIACSALVGIVAVTVAGAPASAVESADSGWWTSAPPLVAADVPEDGLLIQGGVDEPVAYAAVSFHLQSDEQPAALTLEVVPDTFATPETSLALCPLTKPFTAARADAHGEPIDDAPGYDCTNHIPATPSDDGTRFTFDLGDLPAGETVALAVTPSTPVDRVVLRRPLLDSLQTEFDLGGSSSIPPPPPEMGTVAPAPPTPGLVPDAAPVEVPPPPPAAVPSLTPPAANASDEPASTPTEPPSELDPLVFPPLANAVTPLGDEGSLGSRLAFAAIVLAAIAAWAYAGRRRVHAVSGAQ